MINEVSPPGWGHTKAEKEKTKPEKPKSKIGGTAHAMKLAQKRGDIPKNMNIFALMWSMKNKGDKPHYKPGVKDKLKGKYKGPEGQNEMIDPKKIRNYKNVSNAVVAKADKEAQKVKDKEQKGTLEFPQMPTEESTEQDEMIQKVVEYIKTNGKRRKTAGGDGRRTENEATAAELELANAKKADKKQQGGSLKHKVWPASASEDVEIDELSKKVLGRYVKKAAHDTAGAGIDLGVSSQKKGGQTRGDVDKHAGKLVKRQRGIGKAVDKLSKEEVEAPKKESIWDTWRPRVYTEATVAGAVALPVNQMGGTSIWDLSNGEVLRNVNAFVGSIADREYLIPENAVHQLKGFMERVGLTFPEGIQLPTGNGTISIPLQRWGGTFGKTATTPFDEFENEPENVGLDLKITVEELRNNSWKVYAKIV